MNKNVFFIYGYRHSICLFLCGLFFVNNAYCGRGVEVRVVDVQRPDREETLRIYENEKDLEEAATMMSNTVAKTNKSDLSGVEVRLNRRVSPQNLLMKTVSSMKTDKKGVAIFNDVYTGIDYEAVAETDLLINGKICKAKARAFTCGSNIVILNLRTDWVRIKGKVVNADGFSVEGANIKISPGSVGSGSGEFYNNYPSQVAVSDSNGCYELTCVEPLNMDMTCRYLVSSNAAVRSDGFFFGLIHAGKTLELEQTSPKLQIPLISENTLKLARRFISVENKIFGRDDLERKDLCLPKSQGDVIFLPDIIINDSDPKTPAAAKDPKTKK